MAEQDPTPPATGSLSSALHEDAKTKIEKDLGDIASEAKRAFGDAKTETASQLNALKDQAQDQIASATDKAKSFAEEQKDAAGDQLGVVAGAISKVASELDDQPVVAGYARELAGGLQRVSDTVKRRNVDDFLAMAEDFGRTQPVAFLGAAALAGFVASRFVLSSANRRNALNRAPAGTRAPTSSVAPTLEGVTTRESPTRYQQGES